MSNETTGMTEDFKAYTIEGLLYIQKGLKVGTNEHYAMSDLIDQLLSNSVSITKTRPVETNNMPVCKNTADLIANNID